MESRQLFGRRQIYTDVETITAENVVEVLRQALSDHAVNQGEIQYLWDYYRGKTPILQTMFCINPYQLCIFISSKRRTVLRHNNLTVPFCHCRIWLEQVTQQHPDSGTILFILKGVQYNFLTQMFPPALSC